MFDIESMIKIDSELNRIKDLDILLERILLEARSVVSADAGSIYLFQAADVDSGKTNELAIKYSQNNTLEKSLPAGQKLIYSVFTVPINDKTISGYCAQTKQIINVRDAYNLPGDVPYSFGKHYDEISGYRTTSILTIPLTSAEGRLLGVIQVINAIDESGNIVPFTEEDEIHIAHFATTASISLEKAQTMRTMILRLIKMAELRDPKETGSHANRVAGYAVEIYDRWANRKGVMYQNKEKFKDSLRIASMLHDVGKVAISDTILKKPDRFTNDELKIMQKHTVYGAALFDDSQSSLDVLSRYIAFTHHENWDGSGYPGWVDTGSGVSTKTDANGAVLGKKGSEIPLVGRIVGLADVFDALSSKRVYKAAWGEEDVLKEIRALSGTKFDPELVEIFFEALPSIRQIQALYPEVT
ncbi:MAG: HD domain-containing protein [Treponema sp.]|nr:HD domain-containing protein [Treponema sp.]MCL2205617.1 HD domain-containing protein [Treponema sp.]